MEFTEYEILRAARAAHQVNRAYCSAVDDDSQPEWCDAPEWQKNSALAGVKAIIANPAMTPMQSHESWLELKRQEGWKFGPEKRPEFKERPCFVSYQMLPKRQQVKDELFGLVVRAVLGL